MPSTQTSEEKFEMICKNHLKNSVNGSEELIVRCKHLDLASPIKKDIKQTDLEKDLNKEINQTKTFVEELKTNSSQKEEAPKKDQIGELYSEAKILNDPARISKLELKKDKATKKNNLLNPKQVLLKISISGSHQAKQAQADIQKGCKLT